MIEAPTARGSRDGYERERADRAEREIGGVCEHSICTLGRRDTRRQVRQSAADAEDRKQ